MSRLRAVFVRLLRPLRRRRAVVPAPAPPLRRASPPPPPPPPAPAPGRVLTHAGMPVRILFDDGTVLELIADPVLERRLVQLLGGIRSKATRGAEVSPAR